jgi:hypothetical protein
MSSLVIPSLFRSETSTSFNILSSVLKLPMSVARADRASGVDTIREDSSDPGRGGDWDGIRRRDEPVGYLL